MLVLAKNLPPLSLCLSTLGSDSAFPCSALFIAAAAQWLLFIFARMNRNPNVSSLSFARPSVRGSPAPSNKNQRTVGKINQQLYLIAGDVAPALSTRPSVSRQRMANGQFYSAILPRSQSQYWNWHKVGTVWNIGRWLESSRIFCRSGSDKYSSYMSVILSLSFEHMGIKSSAYFIICQQNENF